MGQNEEWGAVLISPSSLPQSAFPPGSSFRAGSAANFREIIYLRPMEQETIRTPPLGGPQVSDHLGKVRQPGGGRAVSQAQVFGAEC